MEEIGFEYNKLLCSVRYRKVFAHIDKCLCLLFLKTSYLLLLHKAAFLKFQIKRVWNLSSLKCCNLKVLLCNEYYCSHINQCVFHKHPLWNDSTASSMKWKNENVTAHNLTHAHRYKTTPKVECYNFTFSASKTIACWNHDASFQ